MAKIAMPQLLSLTPEVGQVLVAIYVSKFVLANAVPKKPTVRNENRFAKFEGLNDRSCV